MLAAAAAVELGPTMRLELKGKAEPVHAALAIGLRPEPAREAAMGALRSPMVGRERELERLMLPSTWLPREVRRRSSSWPLRDRQESPAGRVPGQPQEKPWRARARADAGASVEPIAELASDSHGRTSPQALVTRLAKGWGEARARVLAESLASLTGIGASATEVTDRDTRLAA